MRTDHHGTARTDPRRGCLTPSESRVITLDHRLFAAFGAPAGLHGPELLAAIALAQWAILLGPMVLVVLWLTGTTADRTAAVATAAAAALALAVAAMLSPLLDTPRPFMDNGAFNYLDHVRDGSFPSDHATLAFALAVGLWLRRPPKLPHIWMPLLAVAFAVGWSRVFLGAHYPSDIAGGALVGSAAVAITALPPGRKVLRTLDAVGEQVRTRALAAWRRFVPTRPSSGASDQ